LLGSGKPVATTIVRRCSEGHELVTQANGHQTYCTTERIDCPADAAAPAVGRKTPPVITWTAMKRSVSSRIMDSETRIRIAPPAGRHRKRLPPKDRQREVGGEEWDVKDPA